MEEKAKNGEEEKEEVSEEPHEEEDVNVVAEDSRPKMALDEEEMREDTHATRLEAQTLSTFSRAVDTDIKQAMDKAIKYTQ